MNFFSTKLGIDLGTANVLIYLLGKGIVINEPSVVAMSADKKKILAIGEEAKMMIGRTPDEIIAYRPIKNGVIADYRVTEAMISYFIKKSLGKNNIFKPEVLVSVPAGINSTERRVVMETIINAGAKKVYVVKEPILGVIGLGIEIEEATGRLIVDIGGGTTDIAVISLSGIVTSESVKSAGDKVDKSIMDYIKKKYSLAIGEKTAEKIKIKIGSAMVSTKKDELTAEISGRDYITELPKTIKISSSDIVKAIQPNLDEILLAVKDVLAKTPPELASDIIDSGMILTGGTSQLRNLIKLIKKEIGIKAEVVEDPLTCVAYGAGAALKHLDSYKKTTLSKNYIK